MAHWAQLDESNKVIQVIVTSNDELDEGYEWLINNHGGTWIQTSYNSYGGVHYLQETDETGARIPSGKPHLRYNYALIGGIYDPINDAFIAPKPEPSEVLKPYLSYELNPETFLWELKPIIVE